MDEAAHARALRRIQYGSSAGDVARFKFRGITVDDPGNMDNRIGAHDERVERVRILERPGDPRHARTRRLRAASEGPNPMPRVPRKTEQVRADEPR